MGKESEGSQKGGKLLDGTPPVMHTETYWRRNKPPRSGGAHPETRGFGALTRLIPTRAPRERDRFCQERPPTSLCCRRQSCGLRGPKPPSGKRGTLAGGLTLALRWPPMPTARLVELPSLPEKG